MANGGSTIRKSPILQRVEDGCLVAWNLREEGKREGEEADGRESVEVMGWEGEC
jgi:hypothetical protein